MKNPPTWPNHLPKVVPPNTIKLGLGFQYMNFEEMQTFSPLSTSTLKTLGEGFDIYL
jgi:hypothetical protein